ncbi:hypothetical protein LOD99_8951 [Oopsacas minuta]|uniref:Uncharacterized protein n=1 Tax=Oopsacas minuta TaxID=111878 RepID=A0AAV7JE36_9METZ|nr:hypothetical protein LOD99_8951 [Oopsacas minuta]
MGTMKSVPEVDAKFDQDQQYPMIPFSDRVFIPDTAIRKQLLKYCSEGLTENTLTDLLKSIHKEMADYILFSSIRTENLVTISEEYIHVRKVLKLFCHTDPISGVFQFSLLEPNERKAIALLANGKSAKDEPRILAPFSGDDSPNDSPTTQDSPGIRDSPPASSNIASIFPSRGKKRRLAELMDEKFTAISADLDAKLARRDDRYAVMIAKILKLEDQVDKQTQLIASQDDVIGNLKQEITRLKSASIAIKSRLREHSRKLQSLASESLAFLTIFGEDTEDADNA